MELIFTMAPLLFFLFSMIDVHLWSRDSGEGRMPEQLPKHWVKAGSFLEKRDMDGLNSLDFISDIPTDLDTLRNRPRYEYRYLKGV